MNASTNTSYFILGFANKCLDTRGNNLENLDKIILNETNGNIKQLWLFTEDGHIVNSQDPNKCLDIYRGMNDNGTKVIIYDKHDGDNQKWILSKDGYILSKLDPNKCLTVKDGNWGNRAKIVIWDKKDESHQKWRISYETPKIPNTHFIIGANNKGLNISGTVKNYADIVLDPTFLPPPLKKG